MPCRASTHSIIGVRVQRYRAVRSWWNAAGSNSAVIVIHGDSDGITTNWVAINRPAIKPTALSSYCLKRDIGATGNCKVPVFTSSHISRRTIVLHIYGAAAIRGYRQGKWPCRAAVTSYALITIYVDGDGIAGARTIGDISRPVHKVTTCSTVICGKGDISATIDGEDFTSTSEHRIYQATLNRDIYRAATI